jgi:Ca2+-transporting ATPase
VTPVAILVGGLTERNDRFVQESRAEASLEARGEMSVTTADGPSDGRVVRLDAVDVVPGDVIVLAAGDRVPADGSCWSQASLEVAESALTARRRPWRSPRGTCRRERRAGDRTTALFMNTAVTRAAGRLWSPLPGRH